MAGKNTAVKEVRKVMLRDDLKNYVSLPIEKLVKAAWNYKKDDEFMAGQLVNNIAKNGQLENIIVRELEDGNYEVVNGNHRYDAMMVLQFKNVVAYNLGKIGQGAAEKIAIVTNETRFASDQVKLAQLMADLQTQFGLDDLAQIMPWTPEQIENFRKLTEFNWENPAGTGEGSSEPEKEADGFITVKLRLPESIAEQFNNQIDRVKKLLHPEEEDLSLISPVQAIEKIIQHIARTPDSQVL